MNEWPLINVQYGNTFMISIIFLSNILCWYNIPMKSSVSIRSLASWRKCRCSTLLCASFIFSYKFYKLTVIILMTNAHNFSFVHILDEMQYIFTTQSLHVVLLRWSLSVEKSKSKFFRKKLTQSTENESRERMKL